MNTNKNGVYFGAKQEALITPKEGYKVVSVEVINTKTGDIVPSELKDSTEHPGRCICTFVQPSSDVVIKPKVEQILYSITIEIDNNCSVVFVEQDSLADIEIQTAVKNEDSVSKQATFKYPQHSLNDANDNTLNVGEDIETTDKPNFESYNESPDVKSDSQDNENEEESEETSNTDVVYDGGQYSGVLVTKEATVITQKEYENKIKRYWDWKREYDEGRCTEQKFKDIQKRHRKFYDDIAAGRIIVKES